MSTILTDTEGTDDFSFQYDDNLANAVAPPVLPEREYPATVSDVKKRKSPTTGKDQIIIKHNIAPEDYPVDFAVEFAPEGVDILYYSPDVGNNPKGRFEMKKICMAYGIPLGMKVDVNDFVGKRVRLAVRQQDDDTGKRLWANGLPKPLNG